MRYFSRALLVLLLAFASAWSQTPPAQKPNNDLNQDDIIRITTDLVQTNVVVVDSKDRVIPDLSMADFDSMTTVRKRS